jgi:hypothetical protein
MPVSCRVEAMKDGNGLRDLARYFEHIASHPKDFRLRCYYLVLKQRDIRLDLSDIPLNFGNIALNPP